MSVGVFQKIPDSASPYAVKYVLVHVKCREQHNMHVRIACQNGLSGFYASPSRHADVHENDIGPAGGGHRNRFIAVSRFTDDKQVLLRIHYVTEFLADHRLVIRQHDANRCESFTPQPPQKAAIVHVQ